MTDEEPKFELDLEKKLKQPRRLFYKSDFKISKDLVYIVLLGDEHIGNKYFKYDDWKKTVDFIGETDNCYMVGMGDNCETATRESVGCGVFEQTEIVQEQMEKYIEHIKPLADAGKVLGLHIGNHEDRLRKHSGFNLTKTICSQLKVPYFHYGVLSQFRIGNNTYTMFTTHGSSNARLSHTKIKAVIDMNKWVDADVIASGHTHQLSHHVGLYYQIDTRKRTVVEKKKNYILTGSYLEHWGSYGMQSGYEILQMGSPRVKLFADGWDIRIVL